MRSPFLASILLTLAGVAAAQDSLPSAGSETIDVELKTVPFYAVDAAGQPVYDLALEELVIRVGGEPATPDTLDRWETPGAGAPTAPPGADEPAPPRPARHVFLLFDHAFASPNGWQRSQRLGAKLVDELPASDRLHLLLNDSTSGLRYLRGPVTDAAGRQALREAIGKLGAGARFVRPGVELPAALGASGGTGVGGQELNAYAAAEGLAQAEYQATAVSLATAFEALAVSLERTSAPTVLLVISSGVRSDFYFEGSSTAASYPLGWSVPSGIGQIPRLELIRGAYERSLAMLAAAGVVPIFVNPESGHSVGTEALHHMSGVTGGLFIDGGDLKAIESEIVAASSAYYEAGFYVHRRPDLDAAAEIEIEVRRPGVRAIFPNRLRQRPPYAELTDTQKHFIVIDLVRSGAPSAQLATLHPLEGRLLRQQGKPRVAFDAAWPEAIRGKEIDLYDVTLEMGEGEPRLVRFDRRRLAAAAQPLRVEASLPGRGKTLVWGIVAVEPASGDTYLKRLRLQPES